jgi:hypothetical protein
MIAPLTGLKKEKLTTRGIGCNHRSSAENIGRKKSDEHAGAQAEDDDTPTYEVDLQEDRSTQRSVLCKVRSSSISEGPTLHGFILINLTNFICSMTTPLILTYTSLLELARTP